MSQFKAMLVEKSDNGYTRRIVQRNVEDLPAGDVLIDVRYSSLNYKDGLSATGNPGVTRKFPAYPGYRCGRPSAGEPERSVQTR